MDKIISTKEVSKLSKVLHKQNKRIVLAGGCFDILHIGHITFLEEAKKQGDRLFVMLESDETITKIKGPGRPINTQKDRAKMLSVLTMVDVVISLPPLLQDRDYNTLLNDVKPAIIALTKDDPNKRNRDKQAEKIGAEVIEVVSPIHNQSTTKLVRLLHAL